MNQPATIFLFSCPPPIMQSYALTVDKFLDHAAKWSGEREIVTAVAGEAASRIGYAALRERSNRASGALMSLGLASGDRIGTLAWNTQHHLEIYYAAMGVGLVCHTLNPRLTPAHVADMINEADDRVLAISANLMALLAEVAPLCPRLEHIVILDGAPSSPPRLAATVWDYEALLSTRGAAMTWGAFDEETPAGLCYTSGTTGKPKGALYTHRANYLHTLRQLQADAAALTASDVILVAVPMFHANGWGLPFSAPAAGAKLVLPGRHTDGASLTKLMREERVTIAVGVQTVWLGVIDHLDSAGEALPALKRVMIGGSHCPDALLRRMEARLDARVQTSWGMTELSPLGTVSPPYAASRGAGRPVMGLDLKLTDADGVTLPEQRGVVGRLKVKGHSVVDRYFEAEDNALDAEGYFDTGDLASIDETGFLTICGRAKDLIKSGGEWINPLEIEEIVSRHPGVSLAAVIGRFDEKWGERPVLIIEPREGQEVDAQALLGTLRGEVADWAIPDQVVQLESMPLAATGKIDKHCLRVDYAEKAFARERAIR
jgi:3-(methylthio)propionyl---CoA ligase